MMNNNAKNNETGKPFTRQETAYLLYMIIGSMYHEARCVTPAQEKNLYHSYAKMSPERQIRGEEQVIARMEKLFEKHKKTMASMKCLVEMRTKGERVELLFYTGFENVRVLVYENGRYRVSLCR